MNLDYRVLGPIEVRAERQQLDIGGPRQRRVLGALVLAAGRPVSAERLIDIVWAGDPPDHARNTLRTYIARARRALEVDGPAPLVTDPNGWRLERDPDELDSSRFESLLAAARAMSSDPLTSLTTLEEALALWRGDAFEEFADEDWCAGEAARLDQLRLVAEEERFDAMLGCGLYDEVIGELERFIEQHPVRDRPRAQQMLALYRSGRQVEAVRRFQEYRRFLDAETGLSPSEELLGLERRIVNRDESLRTVAPAGRQLRGYQLGPEIGHGQFGRIHRASQPALGREVAIKVIRPELADDPEFIRRFDSEARIVAQLEHAHIVPLFDYWREPGGAYLVMRYLKGGTAEQLVERTGPLSLSRVARVVDEIGSALATAHAARVVHRDVKPANILFDDRGGSYLSDFGIATLAGAPQEASPRASSADAVYASPEHLMHDAAAASGDIYSFGAVIFALLAGTSPFPRDTPLPELLESKRSGTVPALGDLRADIPAAVGEVIARATAPDPTDRFDRVDDLVVAFQVAASSSGVRVAAPLGLTVRNPYKGLAAFEEADAAVFFGRGQIVDELREHLARTRFVAVVGPSGAGKSSVVRAGLTPKLRRDGAFVVSMTPGEQPVAQLARTMLEIATERDAGSIEPALRTSERGLVDVAARCVPEAPTDVVLVVDQFEELFTVSDAAESEQFMRLVARAATEENGRLRVVVTLRADFYDRPLGHPAISELVRVNTVPVAPLGPIELERAVTRPAAHVGVSVEPGLAATLVADAAGAPASLPLVQYVLTELFDRRDGNSLTLAVYRAIGGLGGAIARRADEIYDGYDDADRGDVRRLFSRLVVPGDGSDVFRRRVRVSELVGIRPGVIEDFAGARLLTFDRDGVTREPTIEVSHEALLREWPRLQRWVDSDRAGLVVLRHLSDASAAWDARGRDPAELYRGGRLLSAEEWAVGHDDQMNPLEREFLEASRAARDAQSQLERRRVRRLRQLVGSLAVIAVLAGVAGLVAYRQREIADDNAAEAERRALENRSSELASEAMLARAARDPDLAVLLAVAAHDASAGLSDVPRPGVMDALHQTIQSSRLERILPAGFTEAAVHPDGDLVALDHAVDTGRVSVWDMASGDLVAARPLGEPIGGLAFSPDGSTLAVAFWSETERSPDNYSLLLLDPSTLATVRELFDGGRAYWRPAWSADGRHVLATGFGGARLWNVEDPSEQREFDVSLTRDFGPWATFVPGTNTIATVASDELQLIDSESGTVTARFDAPGRVDRFAVAPNGRLAAFAHIDGRTVRVVSFDDDRPDLSFDHPDPKTLTFSPDSAFLSVGGNSDSVSVIDLETRDVEELRGHGTGSWFHTFGPAGDTLVTLTIDGSARVWNLRPEGPERLRNLDVGGRLFSAFGWQDDSSLLVSVETGPSFAEIQSHDLAAGTSEVVAEFWSTSFHWPVLSPDGSLVAGFDPDDLIASVIDVESGDPVVALRSCETPFAVDAVNRWVLVNNFDCPDPSMMPDAADARQGLVDLDTGNLIVAIDEPDIIDAAVTPPESEHEALIAYTTGHGGRLVVRRAATGDTLLAWDLPAGMAPLAVDFAPDGSAIGLSGQTREAVVVDVGALLGGVSADDAVTVFEEMTTGPANRVIPLGDRLFVSGVNQVRLWDTATMTLLADIPTEAGQFTNVVPHPDGRSVYYQDAEGVVRRFLVDADDLVDLAVESAQRGFTEPECERYFPDGGCPSSA